MTLHCIVMSECLSHHFQSDLMQNGHAETVKALLEVGADPNERLHKGYTPLAQAAIVSGG